MKSRVVMGIVVISCFIFAAAGCGKQTAARPPKELLALSISGLAGVDRYTFSGTSSAAAADGVLASRVSFQGKVEDHKRIRMQSNEAELEAAGTVGDPLAYLSQIQAEAKRIRLVPVQSGAKTALLEMEADSQAERIRWMKRLRTDFEQAVSVRAGSGPAKLQAKAAQQNHALLHELEAEIASSRQQWNQILQSLQVSTNYQLVIDRKKLLPLQLKEVAVLSYQVDGVPQKETRQLEMIIKPAPDR